MEQTILQEVLTISSDLEEIYRDLLKSYKLDDMDSLVMNYEREVQQADGQLSNDRIRYYSSMFAYYSYALNATLSKQTLRSDVAQLFLDYKEAQHYLDPADGVKMTREMRSATAKKATEQEAKVQVVYARVTQAIENRIKAFNKLLDTLNMLGAMNMSEAKLSR